MNRRSNTIIHLLSIKLGLTGIGVPENIINLLLYIDIGGRTYIKSPWTLSQPADHSKITACPFFTQMTGVPQGSTEGELSWLAIPMVELLQQLVPPDISKVYAPEMNPVSWAPVAQCGKKETTMRT